MKDFFLRFDVLIKIILFIGIFVLGGLFFFERRPQTLVETVREVTGQPNQTVDQCGKECERKIGEVVAHSIATLSASTAQKSTESPKPTSQLTPTPLVVKQPTQTYYVPVGGAGSTTSLGWADLLNTDFYFDVGEYGTVKEIRWSATLKIFQNGQAFVRLFDVTHGVAIQGSEMNTTSYAFTLIESGQLTFYFSGKNRYRVQMKSLTGYEASFDSGRIKIVSE